MSLPDDIPSYIVDSRIIKSVRCDNLQYIISAYKKTPELINRLYFWQTKNGEFGGKGACRVSILPLLGYAIYFRALKILQYILKVDVDIAQKGFLVYGKGTADSAKDNNNQRILEYSNLSLLYFVFKEGFYSHAIKMFDILIESESDISFPFQLRENVAHKRKLKATHMQSYDDIAHYLFNKFKSENDEENLRSLKLRYVFAARRMYFERIAFAEALQFAKESKGVTEEFVAWLKNKGASTSTARGMDAEDKQWDVTRMKPGIFFGNDIVSGSSVNLSFPVPVNHAGGEDVSSNDMVKSNNIEIDRNGSSDGAKASVNATINEDECVPIPKARGTKSSNDEMVSDGLSIPRLVVNNINTTEVENETSSDNEKSDNHVMYELKKGDDNSDVIVDSESIKGFHDTKASGNTVTTVIGTSMNPGSTTSSRNETGAQMKDDNAHVLRESQQSKDGSNIDSNMETDMSDMDSSKLSKIEEWSNSKVEITVELYDKLNEGGTDNNTPGDKSKLSTADENTGDNQVFSNVSKQTKKRSSDIVRRNSSIIKRRNSSRSSMSKIESSLSRKSETLKQSKPRRLSAKKSDSDKTTKKQDHGGVRKASFTKKKKVMKNSLAIEDHTSDENAPEDVDKEGLEDTQEKEGLEDYQEQEGLKDTQETAEKDSSSNHEEIIDTPRTESQTSDLLPNIDEVITPGEELNNEISFS